MGKDSKKRNRLMHETSPYLLQHAGNPVDWFAWGEEAKARAKRENKPVFLSVGYSACHWCHVMERESFEDEKTAELLNAHFINIKVDREERPDIDAVYMSAVQAMTGRGGWPMSVFLTPDLKPFYGGTYFPPVDRHGMPSFQKVVLGVANAWKNKRQEVLASAEEFTKALRAITEGEIGAGKPPSDALFEGAFETYQRSFDPNYGGFGRAPKFFHTMDLRVCLRLWKRKGSQGALKIVTHTLDKLSEGGIYDQLGGGFHRYSTDPMWLVPHFEKMLYDNALLCTVFMEAYQVSGRSRYARIVHESLDWVLREMTGPGGEFYSTLDADTEGTEGKFYVWSKEEIGEELGSDAEYFCRLFNVSEGGNWEGHNILHRTKTLEDWAQEWEWDVTALERKVRTWKERLRERRAGRATPFRDEKIIVSWNALMIGALAKSYQVLDDDTYLAAAQRAARFIREKLWRVADAESDGLLHVYKDGRARYTAFLDDYADLIDALVTLYESDFDVEWLNWAEELADRMVRDFWDEPSKSFFYSGREHEALVARTRDFHDGATPSASSMAVTALLRLGRFFGREDLLAKAEGALTTFEPLMREHPAAAGQLLVALDMLRNAPVEIVVTDGEDREILLGVVRGKFLPSAIVAAPNDRLEWTRDKVARGGSATVYLCRGYACQAPITEKAALETACEALR